METDNERIERIQSAMAGKNIDALVCRLAENVLFLTRYWPMNGFGFALFPCKGKPVLIVPEGEAPMAKDS